MRVLEASLFNHSVFNSHGTVYNNMATDDPPTPHFLITQKLIPSLSSNSEFNAVRVLLHCNDYCYAVVSVTKILLQCVVGCSDSHYTVIIVPTLN